MFPRPRSSTAVDTSAPWSSSPPSDLRITRVSPCVAHGFESRASFIFAGCCWCRSLAVDGCSGASRGHALVMRRPGSRWSGAVERPSASGVTQPQLVTMGASVWCCDTQPRDAVGGGCCCRRCCQPCLRARQLPRTAERRRTALNCNPNCNHIRSSAVSWARRPAFPTRALLS
jgi:hypothetical protein